MIPDSGMLARVATFDQPPEDLDSDAVNLLRKTVRETPGYVAGFHLRSDEGKALSIVVVESMEAGRAVGAALDRRPVDQRIGVSPDKVEFFKAEAFEETVTVFGTRRG